ncbi:hypothetical protein BC832DRAFT_545593 [Gaertneriomyces semiglobifer]|nr:hypothetical protein BC832DRAFT_545593 [Gaertneriomyces semiglobifer]
MSVSPSRRNTITGRPPYMDGDGTLGLGPDPAVEEKRGSLLDVVRDNLQRQGKTTMLYRVILIGGLRTNVDRSDFGAYYQRFFRQYQAETDLITGMLLVFPNAWIHVLEASYKVTLAFLRDLHPHNNTTTSASGSAGSKTINTKLLLLVDDISSRFYPFWSSRVIEPRQEIGEREYDASEVVGDDVVAQTVTDVCVNLAALGTGLSNLQKNDLKTALDEIGTHFRDLIPRPAILSHLVNASNIISIEDWLSRYDGYFKFIVESERVWPIEKPVHV